MNIYIKVFFTIINEYVPNIKHKIHFKLIVKEVRTYLKNDYLYSFKF